MPRSNPQLRTQLLRALGAVITRWRRAGGLTQEQLGELTGMHRTYISAVERGRRNPTVVSLVELARSLGHDPAELLAEALAELRDRGVDLDHHIVP